MTYEQLEQYKTAIKSAPTTSAARTRYHEARSAVTKADLERHHQQELFNLYDGRVADLLRVAQGATVLA